MKKTMYTFTLAIFMAASMFSGCQSPVQKEQAAEEKLQDAEQNLEAVQSDATAQRVATAQEWKVFKSEVDLKIKKNEIRIAELKIKINKPGEVLDGLYEKRIEMLEQRNKELKSRIEKQENSHTDWDVFKQEFNKDLDELGQSLTDFTVDSKK
jgi:hypothetical protein